MKDKNFYYNSLKLIGIIGHNLIERANHSDIQGYDEVDWMTHHEYFYQLTVEDYEFEQYAKEKGLI